ncbi:hypothetical protein HL658_18850, partial [Azospirillum sp. RWY-5-1]
APLPEEEAAPPQGPVEAAIAAVWRDLLGLDAVGRDENFLSLGGDSLLATEMATQVGRRFGIELSLRRIFVEPTIAGLARAVEAARNPQGIEDMEEGTL